jgi:hypothetical protein
MPPFAAAGIITFEFKGNVIGGSSLWPDGEDVEILLYFDPESAIILQPTARESFRALERVSLTIGNNSWIGTPGPGTSIFDTDAWVRWAAEQNGIEWKFKLEESSLWSGPALATGTMQFLELEFHSPGYAPTAGYDYLSGLRPEDQSQYVPPLVSSFSGGFLAAGNGNERYNISITSSGVRQMNSVPESTSLAIWVSALVANIGWAIRRSFEVEGLYAARV